MPHHSTRQGRTRSIFPRHRARSSRGLRGTALRAAASSQGSDAATEPPEGWSAKKVLVLGGGIMGVSVAYHLALRGVASTVVDHAGIASCASGKAAGFLARDWLKSSPLDALARKSFGMHEEVARTLGLKSYRRLRCKSITVSQDAPRGRPDGVEWADVGILGVKSMGDEDAIAQVHPKELAKALWADAQRRAGSQFVLGTANGLILEGDGDGRRAAGAWVNSREHRADAVVLCMGPWAQVLGEVAPRLRMYGVKSHSILLRSERALSEAVYFRGLGNPEVYPRANGENYVVGFPDPAVVVAEPPGAVQVRDAVCERLESSARGLSSVLQGAELSAKQSCYLPWTADEFPAMGRLPDVDGAFVCAGHGCWGILNSLASGLGMSELMLDGKAESVDLAPFDPRRLLAADEPTWAPS